MISRYGTDKLIHLLVPHVPALFHYILYFQDMFSFALNPATLGEEDSLVTTDVCITRLRPGRGSR